MKISIVVTTYDSETTIAKTLNSVKAFTNAFGELHDFYVYVVDDCSSDSTGDVVENFQCQFNSLNYFSFEFNGGISRSRNYGINASMHCDFITFVDGDDELVFSCGLNDLNQLADQDIVCFDHYINNGQNIKYISHLDKDTSLNEQTICSYIQSFLVRPNRHSLFVTCWGKFYNTRLFNTYNNTQFKVGMHLYEDALFINKLIRKKIRISYYKTPLYVYNNLINKKYKVSVSLSETIDIKQFWGFIYPLRQLKWFLVDHNVKYSEAKLLFQHAVAAYTCISIIRICFRIRWDIVSIKIIHNEIKRLIIRKFIANSFLCYDVEKAKGNKILTSLIRKKRPLFVLAVGSYFSKKRYQNVIR